MSEIEDAKIILNGFLRDLTVPVLVLKDHVSGVYKPKYPYFDDEQIYLGMFSLCMQAIVLNCSKYTEFLREYGKVLNEHSPQWTRKRNAVKAELERRGVNRLRSKFIAHNRCDEAKKPLSKEEIDRILKDIAGGDKAIDFLNWVFPDKIGDENIEECVTGIIQLTLYDLNDIP